jgi:hypothetical protein
MVRIRNLLLWSCILLSFNLEGQRIRKNHQEMTPSEKLVYRNAVIARKDILVERALHHATHFQSEIHTVVKVGGTFPNNTFEYFNGTQFLPWHRLFMIDFEQTLRSSGVANADKITLPYWDWRIENTLSNTTWDDAGFLDLTTLNNSGFGITRAIGVNNNLANSSLLNDMMLLTNNLPANYETANDLSTFFSKRLEFWHNAGHQFVGGTMIPTESPRDPVFYLHHNFVDKLWQDWEDKESAIKSTFSVGVQPFSSHYPFTSINSISDSRKISYFTGSNFQDLDVWFASNQRLLLNGLDGNFQATGIKLYCYVAWNGTTNTVEGTIFAGDVRREAVTDNVLADNKGGFVVQSGSTDFRAGTAIELRPGFSVALGALFSAQVVDRPCGYTTNTLVGEQGDNPVFLQAKTETELKVGEGKTYPNPFSTELNIEYNVETVSPLSIEMVNTLGQSVWQKNYGHQVKGLFTTTISTQEMPKGLYHIVIRNAKNQATLKVVR